MLLMQLHSFCRVWLYTPTLVRVQTMFLLLELARYAMPSLMLDMHFRVWKIVPLHPQLVMIEERRWPLGNRTTELDTGGQGLITTVKWKDTLIAWANSEAKVHIP